MRVALGIEYDGCQFAGWQSQPAGNAVQDAVERAIAAVAGHPVRTACAGRTDAGVHALAQVVHFDTEARRPLTAWVRGCNAHLPPAVAVRWARGVGDAFHARFSARARSYRYLLLNRAERPAILAGRVGWHHRPLDAQRMAAAAGLLLGEHDFSAFRAAGCQAKSPMKNVRDVAICRQDDLISIDITANAFLHHMVRNIVGALVAIGNGSREPAWLAELLAGRDRRLAAPTFSAAGLYLVGVDYDPAWQLPTEARIMPPSLAYAG